MTIRPGWVYAIAQNLLRIGVRLAFDFKAYGRRNVPRSGGALLVSNHHSFLDPVLVGVPLDRPVSFMARSGLFGNRAFGWVIRSCNAYPVRQGTGDVGAMRQTIARLQEGHLLNVFPEGSRSEDGALGPIQHGVALVVRRARVPVVPVAIVGSFEAWPRHRRIFRPHPVRVLYGKPLVLHEQPGEQIVKTIENELRRLLAELEAMDRKAP
jgi:1-acyl-sn-glycerol-3-phosphate acyltransferase